MGVNRMGILSKQAVAHVREAIELYLETK
jgi:hypothetical protein